MLGVGSLDSSLASVASFSSRGMTTWSLLDSLGTLKPDLVTAGSSILSLGMDGECTTNSGTSVSASIITGAIALALSSGRSYNTAFIKQAMIRSARKLKGLSITEQGAGVFDLDAFFALLSTQRQKALVHPFKIDLRNNSTYFLPFSRQSVYSSMMPFSLNVTLLNHASLHSTILSSYYDIASDSPEQELLRQCLSLQLQYPNMVWPYFATIKLTIATNDTLLCRNYSENNVDIKVSLLLRNLEKTVDDDMNVE